MNKFIRLQK